ncbi:MAG TPA: nicotinamide riboside transporter PnuC [Sphingobacteriaceae bacterium]|nr:nicotinamide riboside transporter PnuC [Sphingobacteriaceae bacterium]
MIILDGSIWQLLVTQFYQTSWIEWVGTISGFICVYLAAKQNIWSWPIALISVAAYSVLFYQYQLYGDAVLQVYFFGTSIYGWYYWTTNNETEQKPIKSLSKSQWLLTLLLIGISTGLAGWILDNYTPTNVPYADGFCTSMSFVAQFLMTRKIIQNWILWIIVDICYIPLYIYKDLVLTAILYALFLWLATMGYLEWRKKWKTA